MEETGPLFIDALLLLSSGVVAGVVFKRIGLGTVLGYLFAGLVLGPELRLINGDKGGFLHLGELGVVLLLFIIGLELRLSRLWALRRQIFGLGLAQVLITGLILTGGAMALGQSTPASLIIGFGLALSSTAFALQMLEEKGETNTRHGQAAFSVLLFQDLAVVPLLAMLKLLAPFSGGATLDPVQIALSLSAIVALILAGRFLLNPLFRLIAGAGAREVMIATALLVVLGAAMLMEVAGFSMAMGAFIAGVLLAESSYRHELEASIEPFRGVLLGLFFIAVGLSIDLDALRHNWLALILLTPLMMVVKAVVLYALSRGFGASRTVALRIAALLPQGGEFGFVLFTSAVSSFIFDQAMASLLVAIVTLSMALTPLSSLVGRLLEERQDEEEVIDEDFEGAGGEVLMIGFSRFGQMVAQVLLSSGIDVTMIDSSASQIRTAETFGFRVYFGSGLRRDVLEAAGIRRAKIVAVCTNQREVTNQIVELIRSDFPDVKLFVRSYDRVHSLSLRAQGVDYEMRETVESALSFGGAVLTALGAEAELAEAIVADVRRRDQERLDLQEVEGIYAGNDMMTTRVVRPEPLTKPKQAPARQDGPPEGRTRSADAEASGQPRP
ncbi:monovalent cation:proton antiporter-2 (CPA2) family protein [Consotaella salsifontis]|uniref:Kef-type potassium/proton antiporter, CPA2 family n=1 Tax=Consotaella salsifontis TaxID=1365950 RepID=A0A1T4PYU7_9HYPH|nr:monovalent cation:proton antiporter-2 (CPA2) family protein [Consotaella salsifontis]SJZ96477.1 Kef-type potassium/proton antiporter, CPA2 family [Consotaella salsifontis]